MKILIYGSTLLSTNLIPCLKSADNVVVDSPSQSPDLILGLNELQRSSEASLDLRVPMAIWFTDNHKSQSRSAPEFLKSNSFIFCFSEAQKEWFKESGWSNAYYLPLAVDTEVFKPLEKTTNISFMGELRHMTSDSPMVQLLHPLRLKADPKTALGKELQKFFNFINDFLKINCTSLTPIEELNLHREFIKLCPLELQKYIELFDSELWASALFENYNAIMRAKVCRALNPDLKIWGTYEDWKTLGLWPNHQQRRASYPGEWSNIIGSSQIGLNLFRPDPMHGIPLKAYEIASCSMLFTNDHPMLRTVFTPYEDCIVFNSFKEAKEKYDYLINNPEIIEKISANSRKLMIDKHQYHHRWTFMKSCLSAKGFFRDQETFS